MYAWRAHQRCLRSIRAAGDGDGVSGGAIFFAGIWRETGGIGPITYDF